MTNSDLRQRAESVMRLMDQRDELTADIRAAFDAAKSAGFNAAAMRKAVSIARMDAAKREKHETQQMDLEMYLAEIESKAVREAAE